ncbi:unnamed protein product [Paramecium pentaurelia]|uniref:Uncharacterized protein n=1 Tax=Paramecium pentaurelia TaxID=43138 RepID=A0A8S1UC04_9CILI|nr:unnamed protein product [Paramecium pentaurelia]
MHLLTQQNYQIIQFQFNNYYQTQKNQNGLKNVLSSYVIQLFVIKNSEISKQCVFGNTRSENECKSSGFCIWENDFCILNSSRLYNIEINSQNLCKNFQQEDCREQEHCGFYFGQCQDFIYCNILDKDNCQESSYKCVSDGSKWVQMLECSDYKIENGRADKNQNGNYCFRFVVTKKKCKNVNLCEELPIYLTNHSIPNEGLNGRTINEQGYGCIEQMESCSQYANYFLCLKRKIIFFWMEQKHNVLKMLRKSTIYLGL